MAGPVAYRCERKAVAISGFIEYQRREFCKDIGCPIQHRLEKHQAGTDEYEEVRRTCKTQCIHTTYEFHHWLVDHGYEIVRPAAPDAQDA
jgi:hypothetical protein